MHFITEIPISDKLIFTKLNNVTYYMTNVMISHFMVDIYVCIQQLCDDKLITI